MPNTKNNVLKPLAGVIVPIVTPVDSVGKFDDPAIGRVINHIIEKGAQNLGTRLHR